MQEIITTLFTSVSLPDCLLKAVDWEKEDGTLTQSREQGDSQRLFFVSEACSIDESGESGE